MMKNLYLVFGLLITSTAFGQEKNDYPELQVTPKASERIALESEYEKEKPWKFQASISYSAIATMVASLSQKVDLMKDPQEHSKNVGLMVGGGWLALNMYMAYQYQGYTSAHNKVTALPGKTAREQLIKERLSEEEINHLSKIGRTMRWASFTTNFLAGSYMIGKAKKDSNAKVFDGIAIVASFLPIIFSNHYEDVATEQMQYKKKIFGSISSNFLLLDPVTSKWIPGVGIVATF